MLLRVCQRKRAIAMVAVNSATAFVTMGVEFRICLSCVCKRGKKEKGGRLSMLSFFLQQTQQNNMLDGVHIS